MRRALPLALVALAVTALPASAHAGNLTVRSVSASHSATAGLPVAVQAGIGRKGRTPAAKVRFFLSTNGKRDPSDVQLKGDARVGQGRRSGTGMLNPRSVPPDGILAGTETRTDSPGLTPPGIGAWCPTAERAPDCRHRCDQTCGASVGVRSACPGATRPVVGCPPRWR